MKRIKKYIYNVITIVYVLYCIYNMFNLSNLFLRDTEVILKKRRASLL